jgi:hypothetical protein
MNHASRLLILAPAPHRPRHPGSWRRALVAVALAGLAGATAAQQATERYIPLGQSPGVSGKVAMMGTIVGYEGEHLIVTSPAYSAPQRVRMMPATRIWLDRSAAQQTNLSGAVSDLRPGRRVEIRFRDAARRDSAEWVKVQPAP